ncbi:MAG: hypothetical protein GVY05_10550 [Bacteroidetes bacterium]|nr:hypothetical protein [Bacteroidota bacterium]
MAKRLFESIKPRHSIHINRKGKSKKIQDIPKENFMLCEQCEKRFEHIETLTSRKITSINNYNNLKDRFKIKEHGKNKILECLTINPIEFKIFIYSIIWRVSISSLQEFDTFKLDDTTENDLRVCLDKTLKSNHKELLNSISETTDFPNYHYCIFKPLIRNKFSRGIFTAYKMSEFQFGVFTVDYIILFFSKTVDMDSAFNFVSNFQNEKLLITLTGTDDWKMLNELVIRKMLKKKL